MAASASIGAIAAYTRRKPKKAGATSEETAKTPGELGVKEKWLKTPGVIATMDGRYYIVCKDEKHC